MPELPDVEGFRRTLDTCGRGRRLRRVEVNDAGVVHGTSARELASALRGRRFAAPERRGKWLLAPVDAGAVLLMHFGMTGRLLCASADVPVERHDRVVFTFDDARSAQLRYRDQRKLKGLWLVPDAGAVGEVTGEQGPDALRISRPEFEEALAGSRAGVKSALTNQSRLAGLGNLLADEILWRARLDPTRRTDQLTGAERRRLHEETRRVLEAAVPEGRVPPRADWLTGRRADAAATCPRCGGPLRHGRVAGRGTVWCPHCQR